MSTPTKDVRKTRQVQVGLLAALELSPETVAADLGVSEALIDDLREVATRVLAYQRSSKAIDFTAAERLLRKNQSRRRYWLECFREGTIPECDYGRAAWKRDYWEAHSAWEEQLWRTGYDFDAWQVIGFHGAQADLRSALPSRHFGVEKLLRFSAIFEEIVAAGPAAVEVALSLIRDGIFDGAKPASPEDLLAVIGAVQLERDVAA